MWWAGLHGRANADPNDPSTWAPISLTPVGAANGANGAAPTVSRRRARWDLMEDCWGSRRRGSRDRSRDSRVFPVQQPGNGRGAFRCRDSRDSIRRRTSSRSMPTGNWFRSSRHRRGR